MRLTFPLVAVSLALASGVGFPSAGPPAPPAGPPASPASPAPDGGSGTRQSSGADAGETARRLAEFLNWAHPAAPPCAPPADVRILETWAGGLMARYRIACGASETVLRGVFQIREKDDVWQVASGFEAAPEALEAALAALRPAPPGRRPAPVRLAPPPAGLGAVETPLDLVPPPAVISEARPDYPEEAGRARLIGEARVELLVQVSPDGVPLRIRPLRGPDPDLGMRRAGAEAVLRWRFQPARLDGRPVTAYAPVELAFPGLPAESRSWIHRALFHVEAIVSSDDLVIEEAQRRLRAGEAFETVAGGAAADAPRGGDWGFVPAATLPAPVRKALHEARLGEVAPPVTAEGRTYLLRKVGEVYYAIQRRPEGDLTYQVVHQRNAPSGEALRQAIESDIADYLAESRREAYVNEAARLMGIRQARARIGQLEIHTDVLDEAEIQALGEVVEAAFRAHEAFWAPWVPLRPFSQQVLVFAWARQADHDRLHHLWRSGRETPPAVAGAGETGDRPETWSFAGEYIPSSRILAVPCERTGGHLPVPNVVHEAIHMLDHERVYRSEAQPSQWFEEGLATYFGFSQIGSRLHIEAGDIRRSGTIVLGRVRLQFDPRTPLNEYMRRVRQEGAVPLRTLLASNAGDPLWSGDRAVLAYSASWTLVHFLLHGDRRVYRERFGEYAREEALGAGGPVAFARIFGPDLAALEAAWHDYEESL